MPTAIHRILVIEDDPNSRAMVLDGFGVIGQDTDDLRFRAHTYQGTVGMRTGTALEHIAHVAEDLGLKAVGLMIEPRRASTDIRTVLES